MSKIIISIATLSSGGAERVLSVLSTPFAQEFGDVTYVMWLRSKVFYQIDPRVRLISIEDEVHSKNILKKMKWFRDFVSKESPNVILSFLEPWNIRVLLSTIGLGIKTVVAERNDPRAVNKYWIMNQIEKLIYRRADMILVQTETIREFFTGVLKDRTHIIYNPVNIQPDMVGKALSMPKKKRIVSVARLMPQKRHDVLIKAFAKFSKLHPGYTLTIYGSGSIKESLERLASSLNIGETVIIPGPCKSVHQEILDAEMMCLVSDREGMSNAMIEAMCLGLPCICTKVSGAIDLIESGKNGILVDIGDVEGLCHQMCKVADNREYARSLGKEAASLYGTLRTDIISKIWIDYLRQYME